MPPNAIRRLNPARHLCVIVPSASCNSPYSQNILGFTMIPLALDLGCVFPTRAGKTEFYPAEGVGLD